jgi:phospholipase/carboxylesterase
MTLLNGPSLAPRSGGKPRQLVVFLHGLGADGHDLISLAPYFAEALPEAEFLSPHAPFPCDMASMGRQWFSLQDRSPEVMLAGLSAARPILDEFLDVSLEQRGLAEENLLLIGFSQGTMMALFTALRRARACAGIVGYSGLLAAPDRLREEIVSRPPVLLVHGDQDPVVSYQFMELARATLELLQVPVTALTRPGMGHSIDDEGLTRGIGFAVQCFAKKQA